MIDKVLPDEVLHLNVGGKYYPTVSKRMLTSVPGTALEAMFSGRHELEYVDGKIFVDRNPIMFEYLIDYLRNGCKLVEIGLKYDNQMFLEELDYWGL